MSGVRVWMARPECISKKWTLKKILLKYDRGKIKIPEVQREFVWTKPQMQLLVDSVLRSYDIPKIYFREDVDRRGEYHVYDGQQRLRTLITFLKGDFRLPLDSDPIVIEEGDDGNDEIVCEIAGKKFEEFDEDLIVEFEGYNLDVVHLENFSDDEADEMFYRLQHGTPLNPAEKRRALPGDMRNIVKGLAEHAIFGKPGFIIFSPKRYAFEDAIAKVMHQFIAGDIVSISANQIKGTYMNNQDIDENHPAVKRLKKTMNFVNTTFDAASPPGLRKFSFISLLYVIDKMNPRYNLSNFKDLLAQCYIEFEDERISEREKDENEQNPILISYNDSARGDSVANMEYRVKVITDKIIAGIPELELKDSNRLFSEDQKRVIFYRSEGKCQGIGISDDCEIDIDGDDFHADHILAHSRGGKTKLSNAQALCSHCNLAKSDSG